MSTTLDFTKIPEADRTAFYESLFAIAAADGTIDAGEKSIIFETMSQDEIPETTRQEVINYLSRPPQLSDALEKLTHAEDIIRYGLMICIVDIAWADDILTPSERKAILLAQEKLRVTPEQAHAIDNFIEKVKEISTDRFYNNEAMQIIEDAIIGLSSVGIPPNAAYFSGTLVGMTIMNQDSAEPYVPEPELAPEPKLVTSPETEIITVETSNDTMDGNWLVSLTMHMTPPMESIRRDVQDFKRKNSRKSTKELAEKYADNICWKYTSVGVASALPSVIPGVGTAAQIAVEAGTITADLALMLRWMGTMTVGIGMIYDRDAQTLTRTL